MDLQTTAQLLGNFGEFAGAIAVVITLGYLAVQVKQNTKSMDRSTRTERAKASYDHLNNYVHLNSQAIVHAELYLKALRSEELSDIEAFRWNLMQQNAFRFGMHASELRRNDLITPDQWNHVEAVMRAAVTEYVPIQNYWKATKHQYPASYQLLIDGFLGPEQMGD